MSEYQPGYDVRECALMTVTIVAGDFKTEVKAIAVCGQWAATPCFTDKGRFVVTHLPSSGRTGPSMTERDALRTLAKLRDVVVLTTEDLLNASEAIEAAHPVAIRRRLTLTKQRDAWLAKSASERTKSDAVSNARLAQAREYNVY